MKTITHPLLTSGLIACLALLGACGPSGSTDQPAASTAAPSSTAAKAASSRNPPDQGTFSFTIVDGPHAGQTATIGGRHVRAMSRWRTDENNAVSLSSVTFVDPINGNNTFSLKWDGDKALPLGSEEPSSESQRHSYIELGATLNEQKVRFTSVDGTVSIGNIRNHTHRDTVMKRDYPLRDADATFEGSFKQEGNSGGTVRIRGSVQLRILMM